MCVHTQDNYKQLIVGRKLIEPSAAKHPHSEIREKFRNRPFLAFPPARSGSCDVMKLYFFEAGRAGKRLRRRREFDWQRIAISIRNRIRSARDDQLAQFQKRRQCRRVDDISRPAFTTPALLNFHSLDISRYRGESF